MGVWALGWRWERRKGVSCRKILYRCGHAVREVSFPKSVVGLDMRLMIGRG